jgi:hypothetical protein
MLRALVRHDERSPSACIRWSNSCRWQQRARAKEEGTGRDKCWNGAFSGMDRTHTVALPLFPCGLICSVQRTRKAVQSHSVAHVCGVRAGIEWTCATIAVAVVDGCSNKPTASRKNGRRGILHCSASRPAIVSYPMRIVQQCRCRGVLKSQNVLLQRLRDPLVWSPTIISGDMKTARRH